MAIDAASYSVMEILRDGTSILIRAIRPDDKQKLLRHFMSLSAKSVYYRFFEFKRQLAGGELKNLTELDFVNQAGLCATLSRGDEEIFIGVGRYFREPGASTAESGFAVLDEYQGHGIGTPLLEHLALIAREAGITEFEANVLGDNSRMPDVLTHSGFRVKSSVESCAIRLSFPIDDTQEAVHARRAREPEAAARSVGDILNPRAVAVIGALRDTAKIGGAVLTLSGFSLSAIRAIIEWVPANAEEPCWLGWNNLFSVLRDAGLAVAASEQVPLAAAVAAAQRPGYPLVVKAIAPGLIHKSDVGGVIIDVNGDDILENTLQTLKLRIAGAGFQLEEVLL